MPMAALTRKSRIELKDAESKLGVRYELEHGKSRIELKAISGWLYFEFGSSNT